MFNTLPRVTGSLIIFTGIVFFGQNLANQALIVNFALWPIGPGIFAYGFRPWQIITYSFLHGGIAHLLLNMFALYMFGGELERLFGSKRFFYLYFISVITAGLTQLIVTSASHSPPYPTAGASGGVFGILLAYALHFPHRRILLLIPPIPLPAWLFVTLYGLIELFLGITGTMAGVAHFAHLGGMIGAWLVIRYWRGRFPFQRR
jgi:membrane associated rhomboid family serine protease